MEKPTLNSNTRWDRSSYFAFAIAVAISLWSVVGLVIAYAAPTDGWFLQQPDPFGEINYIYRQNLVGAPSDLHVGDRLVAIEGYTSTEAVAQLADRWQVGNRVRYTVERGDAEQGQATTRVDVMVPLVSWQLGPALIYLVRQNGIGALIGEILFAAIAIFVFLRRPRDAAARVMFFYAILYPTIGVLSQTTNSNPVTTVSPMVGLVNIITIILSYNFLFPPALLHFALVFPHAKPFVQRRRFLIPALYLFGIPVLIGFVTTNSPVVPYSWTIFSIVGAILILIHSAFTMRDAMSRAQLMWGLGGVVISLLLFGLTFPVEFGLVTGTTADILNFLFSLNFSVLGFTLGIAILRYRLFDIDVIIRRTLTYSVVSALLAGIYFGLVAALQYGFRTVTGSDSQLAVVVSTLVIATLFLPLRSRVQAFIDRRFYRSKYNAEQTLMQFTVQMRDAVELDEINEKLLNAVDATLQPGRISLWLADAQPRKEST